MIHLSEFVPRTARGISPVHPRGVDATNFAALFEGNPLSADLRIGADLGVASRGLSVAQHAERVLRCLCEANDRRP